jgi:hypothetical protein
MEFLVVASFFLIFLWLIYGPDWTPRDAPSPGPLAVPPDSPPEGTKGSTIVGEPAEGAPAGKYLAWPVPAVIILLILGAISASVGSGGSPEGWAVAYALNPLNWAMVWAVFQIGKIQCPHCRRAVGGTAVRNAAIGTCLRCPRCENVFAKPASA